MKKILLLLLMLMSVNLMQAREITRPPVETPPPTINVTETEDFYIIEAVGEGEVNLYVNDEPVENPYTIARPEPGEDAIVIYVYATAQNPGQEIGTSDVERIEIDPKEGYFPDPHETGVWIVLRDRNGEERWIEMYYDNGDYLTTIRLTNTYLGDFNSESDENYLVPIYIFFEGIRFGAPSPNRPINFGYENILIENNHCYVIETGYRYIIGVTFFDDFYEEGNLYLYAVRLPLHSEDDSNEHIKGDANRDGKVTIFDVITIIDYLLSGDTSEGEISQIDKISADCDGNGQVTITDITHLIDYLLKGSWY